VLRARRPERADAGTHDGDGLAAPGAVTIRTRGAIDGVLQHAGYRVVVFRRHEQNRIRGAHTRLQLDDFRMRMLFFILVETRNAIELEDLERHAVRSERACRTEGR